MIVIYGTHVQSDNISRRFFFTFFQNFDFLACEGVKGQKMA